MRPVIFIFVCVIVFLSNIVDSFSAEEQNDITVDATFILSQSGIKGLRLNIEAPTLTEKLSVAVPLPIRVDVNIRDSAGFIGVLERPGVQYALFELSPQKPTISAMFRAASLVDREGFVSIRQSASGFLMSVPEIQALASSLSSTIFDCGKGCYVVKSFTRVRAGLDIGFIIIREGERIELQQYQERTLWNHSSSKDKIILFEKPKTALDYVIDGMLPRIIAIFVAILFALMGPGAIPDVYFGKVVLGLLFFLTAIIAVRWFLLREGRAELANAWADTITLIICAVFIIFTWHLRKPKAAG